MGKDQPENYRLLFLTDILEGMGGAERNLFLLAHQLRARRHEVTIACLKGGEVSEALERDGFAVHVFNLGKILSLRGLLGIWKMRSLILREKISVVMTYHLSSDIIGACIALTTGVPVVSSRRDLGFQLTEKHNRFYRFFNRQYTAISAVSVAVKDAVVKTQRIDPSRITVIHNGVAPEPLSPPKSLPKEYRINESKIKICCLANIRPIKGHKYLLEAVNLLKNHSLAFRLYLIGLFDEKDPCYQELREIIRERKLDDLVMFTGGLPSDEVFGFLKKMDISVLPSLSEGMPNTLLESMAAGLPVVATAVGGSAEVVRHGETGYLVPAENAEELADALLHLLENSGERQDMAEKARKRFKEMFSAEIMTERYEDLLRYAIIKKQKRKLYRGWARSNFFTLIKQYWKSSIANIFFFTKITWLYRRVKCWMGKNRVLILCLHDVVGAESKWLMFYIATFSEHFTRIIDTINKYSQVVSLEQACRLFEGRGKLDKDVVAITFDDCYSSFNGEVFRKCSEIHMPYAVFLNTYPLDQNKFLLHDVLIYLATNTWRKVVAAPHITEEIFLLDSDNAFRHFVDVLFHKLQRKPFVEWNTSINVLAEYLDVDLQDEKLPEHFLSWSDVRRLHESGVTIGAHTVTHPLLTAVTDEECYKEINDCKQRLESELNAPVQFFSYPYGHRASYDEKVVGVVEKCGFRYACTLIEDNEFSSPFTISRRNVSPGQFLSGNGAFSRALFELELSGLGDIVFGRWLRKLRA